MNIRETLRIIDAYKLVDQSQRQQDFIVHDAMLLGIPLEAIKFRTTIMEGCISAEATIREYDDLFKNYGNIPVIEAMIDHPLATMGWEGKTIKVDIERDKRVAEVQVQSRLKLEATLPLDYIGVLVGLGRLHVTNSNVHCGV